MDLTPDASGSGGAPSEHHPSPSAMRKLLEREKQMMELLGSSSPDRLVHDLRNLMNEVQLLRVVLRDEKA